MGDFDDGMESGAWGADGMPNWMDDVDNTAAIQKLEQELQTLKATTPKDKGDFTILQGVLVLGATIFGFGGGGVVLAFGFILYNEPKGIAYKEHMDKIYRVEQKIEQLYS